MIVGDVDNTSEVILFGVQSTGHEQPSEKFGKILIFTKPVRLEIFRKLLGQPRDECQRKQTHQHGHGAEGEKLLLGLLVIAGEVNGSWQAKDRLAARQPHEERDEIRRQAAVSVAVMFEMNNHEKLKGGRFCRQIRD